MKIARSAANVCLTAASAFGQIKSPWRNAGAMLVSGSPRGGTTWIAESLAAGRRETRLLWEPLQDPLAANVVRELSARPGVNALEENAQLTRYLHRVFTGRLATTHTCRLRRRGLRALDCARGGPLLVKFVRGNGIVAAASRAYGARRPLVVIRHPCAVVASQLKMGVWDDHPHVSPRLAEVYPDLHASSVRVETSEECLAVTWAADVLAGRYFGGNYAHFLYYEDAVAKGVAALDSVLEDWESDFLDRSCIESVMARSSTTTHAWSSHHSAEAMLSRWQEQLSEAEQNAIIDVVRDCGVIDYNKSTLPVASLGQ